MGHDTIPDRLFARLDTLKVPARLNRIRQQVWNGAHVIRGTDNWRTQSSTQYASYLSLTYDYPVRYVSFQSRGNATLLERHVLPAEEDRDYLSMYGRASAKYVKGEKRTQLFVAGVQPAGSSQAYLMVLDGHDTYLMGDYGPRGAGGISSPNFIPRSLARSDSTGSKLNSSVTLGNGEVSMGGKTAADIEMSDDNALMEAFLDHWLSEACKHRARSHTLPQELRSKAQAMLRAR